MPQSRTKHPARRRLIEAWLLVLSVAAGVHGAKAMARTPVDRFLDNIAADPAIPTEAGEMMRSTWAACQDCDGGEFLTQALVVLFPNFCEGLDAYDRDDYPRCARIMNELKWSSDPFVASHAAAYEIKSLVAMERPVEAGRILEQLWANERERVEASTYLAGELGFLRGYCLLSDVRYNEAERALEAFLSDYPDAPLRLTVPARQMLAELVNRLPGEMGEVVDLMRYSRRRLATADAGQTVQERQRQIIDLLDGLIEEAEDQESKGGSGSGSQSGGRGGGNPNSSPNQPMPDSRLPGGRAGKESLRSYRRANPAEAWGALPPAQRERILQALRDSFPSRYRKLVEQYYEELAKKP